MKDPKRLARIREMPCAMVGERVVLDFGVDRCNGPIEANHATYQGRGMGQKSGDETAFPLCLKHHANWHDGACYFRGWDMVKRQEFEEKMVAAYADPGEEFF